MPAQQRPATTNGKGPIHTLRHRNLKATIWRNDTDKGPMFNVTLVRAYRDDAGEWQDSHSFGYDDLMNVSALLYEAHAHISAVKAKENATRPPTRAPVR